MSHISIRRAHGLSDKAAMDVTKKFVAPIATRYGLDLRWAGTQLNLMRLGLRGTLSLNPGEVAVELTLSLLLSGYRVAIEREINDALDQHFSTPSPGRPSRSRNEKKS